MTTVRVFFRKTGRAKYISHLDTMRTLTRALRRSRLPLWYTEGFNPHLYLTFALPIALGYESDCESFDIRLTREIPQNRLEKALAACFPVGFAFASAAPPQMEPKEIAWADYQVILRYAGGEVAGAGRSLEEFMGQPVIEVVKRTKKGDKTIDIKPLSQLLHVGEEAGALRLKLRMAAGISLNVNPTLWLHAFYRWANLEPEGVKIRRTAILTETLENFA